MARVRPGDKVARKAFRQDDAHVVVHQGNTTNRKFVRCRAKRGRIYIYICVYDHKFAYNYNVNEAMKRLRCRWSTSRAFSTSSYRRFNQDLGCDLGCFFFFFGLVVGEMIFFFVRLLLRCKPDKHVLKPNANLIRTRDVICGQGISYLGIYVMLVCDCVCVG